MDKVNDDLPPLAKTPNLDTELDKMQDLLNSLNKEYKAKKDAKDNSVSSNNTGQKRRHTNQCQTLHL